MIGHGQPKKSKKQYMMAKKSKKQYLYDGIKKQKEKTVYDRPSGGPRVAHWENSHSNPSFWKEKNFLGFSSSHKRI